MNCPPPHCNNETRKRKHMTNNNTEYGIKWVSNIDWGHTRESAIASMTGSGYYLLDNGDDDCMVWQSEDQATDDDGSKAVGRLVWR